MILTIESARLVPAQVIHHGRAMSYLGVARTTWRNGTPTIALVLYLGENEKLLPEDEVQIGEQIWTCHSRIDDDEYGAGFPSTAVEATRGDPPAPAPRPVDAFDLLTAIWQMRLPWGHVWRTAVDVYTDVCAAEAIAVLNTSSEESFGLHWNGAIWAWKPQAVAVAAIGTHITSEEILRAALDHPLLSARTKAKALSHLL